MKVPIFTNEEIEAKRNQAMWLNCRTRAQQKITSGQLPSSPLTSCCIVIVYNQPWELPVSACSPLSPFYLGRQRELDSQVAEHIAWLRFSLSNGIPRKVWVAVAGIIGHPGGRRTFMLAGVWARLFWTLLATLYQDISLVGFLFQKDYC